MKLQMATRRLSRRPRSRSVGQGILVLGAVIFLIVIPVIGLFAFEVQKYQFAMQQVQEACDAAALAGGSRLIDAQNIAPGQLAQKHLEAIAAAVAFYKLQNITGVSTSNAGVLNPDSELTDPQGPNETNVRADIVDDSNPPVHVAVGNVKGRAVRVSASFNEVPAFLRHAGVTRVPVRGSSLSGMPKLDIVLVFDMSGSMDDCTRISMVNKALQLTPAARQQLESILANEPKPPTESEMRSACESEPDPDACAQAICNNYESNHQNWMNTQFTPFIQNDDNYFIKYQEVATGKLRTLVEDYFNGLTTGTRINAIRPQSLNRCTVPPCPVGFPYIFRGHITSLPSNGNCGGIQSGITDLVPNMDGRLNIPEPVSQVPVIFGPANYTSGGTDPDGFQFPNLATAVEASRGAMDSEALFQQSMGGSAKIIQNTQTEGGFVFPPRKPGYREAFERSGRRYLQPLSTCVDAARAFVDAIADSGKDIRLSMTGFEEETAPEPPPPPPPPPPPNPFPPPTYNEQDVDFEPGPTKRVIPFVGMVPANDPAGISFLKSKLDLLYSCRTTNMNESIVRAHAFLTQPGLKRPGSKQIIILFTDGLNTGPDPRTDGAVKCKNSKIPIYAVALAQDADLIGSQAALLGDCESGHCDGVAGVSGNGARYIPIEDAAKVRQTFLQLARRLVRLQ